MSDDKRVVVPKALRKMADDAVAKLDLGPWLESHWPDLFAKLEDADANAEAVPIDAKMMFVVLSLPVASSVIHLASTRHALAAARTWVAQEWDQDADPVPILSALTLAKIAIQGFDTHKGSPVWTRIMNRVNELTDDLTDDDSTATR